MEEKVEAFRFSCLHCHRNGNCVSPRPLGEALHETTCNEVLHFDFISMHQFNSKSNHTVAYVLILKDDLSGFVELIPSSSRSIVVADALMDWYRRFGFPQYLVSNQESGFRDQDFRDFNRIMETNHQFVTTYPP
jgi:hypothetical protein